MSIMFPTIFALGIKGLGDETKTGSSYMVMAIVGGALIPVALTFLGQHYGMQFAYIIPLICFLVVALYGIRGYRIKAIPVHA
jgi:FHS family L-fucose permease-like MFS transporter